MTPRSRITLLWFAAILGPLAAGYSLLSVVFYAWLEASGSWPKERASVWAGGAFFFFCVFAIVSVIAIVQLFRHYNSLPHLPDHEETPNT
jgi:hypothetical protein